MKVLILEDNDDKYTHIRTTLEADIPDCRIKRSGYFSQFVIDANSEKFDLVVTDLLVPMQKDAVNTIDVTHEIIITIRDTECPNFSTPVIAITFFSEIAQQNYEKFNRLDINIINYSVESQDWAEAFLLKARKSVPKKTYDFVIFCALEMEADAFECLNYEVGATYSTQGLTCRSIKIGGKEGVIIVPPRMGLVNAAITCSRAIDIFNPRLICMSGICAGIEGKANIYDVVISDLCHQHDSGKWTSEGFIPELYTVQIPHDTRIMINRLIKEPSFINFIKDGVILKKDEFPSDSDELNFEIKIAPSSSGSSVVASDKALEGIREQHRKMTSFEMESYALYEAARQSGNGLAYFSAKSVVDNGDQLKSDSFHRIACLLSSKTVCELINRGIV